MVREWAGNIPAMTGLGLGRAWPGLAVGKVCIGLANDGHELGWPWVDHGLVCP